MTRIDNEVLRALIAIAQSRINDLEMRKQTRNIKWALEETRRIVTQASACLQE